VIARIALLALLAVGLAGCSKPTAGRACRLSNQLVCTAPDRALVCTGGAWFEIACKGKGGCARRGDGDNCDNTIAAEGDSCSREPPADYSCSADGARALVCKDGHFVVWRQCRGADGCEVVSDGQLRCDTTLGEPGDPCVAVGTYACSVDRKAKLGCDAGFLVPASSCRGPKGCSFERATYKVACDDTLAFEGDPCELPNRITCGVDGGLELVCDAHRYAKKRACRRSACRVDVDKLFCD
jgi:hypothetical protein